MKVKINKGSQRGFIKFDPDSGELEVEFPDESARLEIESYLSSPRLYRIPESDRIDDFREEAARPTDSEMYMDLALNELYSELDVMVKW